MQGRRKGGQPGNTNAVTHGRFSQAKRSQRAAAAEERRQKELEWQRKMPSTDYGAICDALAKLKR